MRNETSQQRGRSSKRDQLVEAAYNLFRENGFYATGVDPIIRAAKVSKRTLYKYFPSKNDLIVAVLDYYRATYKNRLNNLLDQRGKTSREKILTIFDDAKHWFVDTDFHGCLAVNAMGEFSGKDRTIEKSCQYFKQWELDVFRTLVKDITVVQPDELAHKLFVLLEGMASVAQVTKGIYPIDMTAMANEVIENHVSSKNRQTSNKTSKP